MKLAIIGGTGFLGKCFLEEYGPTFSQITLLTRTDTSPNKAQVGSLQLINGTLGNRDAIDSLLSGMDVLVHAGFDHTYTENIRGIRNILYSVNQPENTIRRVVYLSSYVVYDRGKGTITEESTLSRYCDIYTREKIQIEKIIRQAGSLVEFIILQPTIVLGSGGNWSKVLAEAAQSEIVKLSNGGTATCNFVHVRDVAQAIERAVKIPGQHFPAQVTSILITGGKASWKEVLMVHGQIKANGGSTEGTKARIESTYDGKYGNSLLQNFIIATLYTSILRTLTHPVLKFLKRRIERSKLNSPNFTPSIQYSFQGLSKAIQQTDHQVSGEKARATMSYKPSFSLSDIAEERSI